MQMLNIDGEQYMSVQETADAIGVSTGRVRQIIVAGELERQKLGNTNWIKADSVRAYIEAKDAKRKAQE